MTAAELDRWLRGQLAQIGEQRPEAALSSFVRERNGRARAAFTAAVAQETGLPGEFVEELLARRDQVRQSATHSFEAWRLAADSGFVTAVMAAWASTMAARAAPKGRQARAT
jgi:hypothetical protein